MKRQPRSPITACVLGLAVVLLSGADAAMGQPTCRDSKRLEELVAAGVADVVSEDDTAWLESQWPTIVATAVALSVVEPEIAGEVESAVHEFQLAAAETARDDKQVGAGGDSTGTTTLVQKMGLPRLLALALEHNAIQQESNGTSLTLRSTPYALWLFLSGHRDTADEYQRAGELPRIGLSGGFALDGDENEAPGDLDFERFTSFEAKWQFFGDRSPRSKAFQEQWQKDVQPAIQADLVSLGGLLDGVFNQQPGGKPTVLQGAINPTADKALEDLTKSFDGQLAASPQAAAMTAEVLARLESDICAPLRTKQIAISDAERQRIATLAKTHFAAEYARRTARARFLTLVEAWKKTPGGSLAYNLQRVDDGSDYSQFTLIFQASTDSLFRGTVAGVELTANAGLSLNHNTDGSDDVDRIRDYSAALSVGRGVDNVLTGRLDPSGLARIGITLSGEVKRLEMADDVLGAVQLKLSIPLYAGAELPLSFSWSSRSEENDEDLFRVSFGGGLDGDKLLAFAALARGLLGNSP